MARIHSRRADRWHYVGGCGIADRNACPQPSAKASPSALRRKRLRTRLPGSVFPVHCRTRPEIRFCGDQAISEKAEGRQRAGHTLVRRRAILLLVPAIAACNPGPEDRADTQPPRSSPSNSIARAQSQPVLDAREPERVERGGERYFIFCSPCHGATG